MDVKKRMKLWKAILSKPWQWSVTFIGALGLFTLIRDEFINQTWRDKLRVLELLPDWNFLVWTIIGLVVLLFGTLEGAYQAAPKETSPELLVTDVLCEPAIVKSGMGLGPKHSAVYVKIQVMAQGRRMNACVACVTHLSKSTTDGDRVVNADLVDPLQLIWSSSGGKKKHGRSARFTDVGRCAVVI